MTMGLILLLILAGILLLLAEIFIIPGIGVAGFFGVASLTGSCYYAFTHLGHAAGIGVTVFNVILLAGLIIYCLRSRTWKRFELAEVISDPKTNVPVFVVGDRGVTVTRLAPMGTARIAGRTVEVTSDEGMLDPGISVEIVRIEGNKIFVKHI